jgi:NAD-dependent dihydropyrimidine dehydrogenase PreA subunit
LAYIITDPCIGTKDTACVEVCPVDCIHPTESDPDFADRTMLFIDPETCIDCDACAPVCPVSAIYPEDELPDSQAEFVEINALYYSDADEAEKRAAQHVESCSICKEHKPEERQAAH